MSAEVESAQNVDYEPAPRPTAGERLRALRTLIIGFVAMWVVLVAAWAIGRAFDVYAASQREHEVQAARLRLAGVAELSGVFNQVNTAIEPAVVKIDVIRPSGPRQRMPYGLEIPEANSGSGVIVEVDKSDRREVGYVVTNHHVVAGASGNGIMVTLSDGRRVDARTLGTDPQSDLAVLRIEGIGLIAAEWGDSDTLRKGDWVLAFGSPFGFVGSMTAGIVSALNRTQTDGIVGPLQGEAYQNFIQVDAAINPGNSGGPLVNVQGQIVGINSAIFTRTGDFSGIGFAIPSNQARRVFEDIRDKGRVVRGWLGVSVAAVRAFPQVAARLGFDATSPDVPGGVLVTEVYQDTPAAEAGLRRGDIITLIDGLPVDDSVGVRNRAAFARPGETLELQIFRNGEHLDIPVVVGRQPDGLLDFPQTHQPQGDADAYGLKLDDPPATAASEGTSALVTAVRRNSIAYEAGIRPGDHIFAINGEPVAGAESARALLARSSPKIGVELRLASQGRVYVVVLREE